MICPAHLSWGPLELNCFAPNLSRTLALHCLSFSSLFKSSPLATVHFKWMLKDSCHFCICCLFPPLLRGNSWSCNGLPLKWGRNIPKVGPKHLYSSKWVRNIFQVELKQRPFPLLFQWVDWERDARCPNWASRAFDVSSILGKLGDGWFMSSATNRHRFDNNPWLGKLYSPYQFFVCYMCSRQQFIAIPIRI